MLVLNGWYWYGKRVVWVALRCLCLVDGWFGSRWGGYVW